MKKIKKYILFLIVVFLFVISCGKIEKGFSNLEKGLIGILENKDESYIKKQLYNSASLGNEDAFGLAYLYFGEKSEDFFDDFLKKSKGLAEYYKGILLTESGASEEERVNIFLSSVKQGDEKAYYMLGNIYQDKLEFSTAQEYFEKGKEKGEIYSTYSYNYNKNLTREYKRIEELNKKLKENKINVNEKKELGTLVLEKFSNYEVSYEILKEFISEGYPPAVYSKAKKIEEEDKKEEALQIYNELFFKNHYYLAAFELAYNLVNINKNYELAIKVLEDTNSEDTIITGYKGFIYEKLKNFDKAEEYYLKAVRKNDIDIMNYLGNLYIEKKEIKKAKDIWTKAYNLGSISAGYHLAELLEEKNTDKVVKNKNNETATKYNKEAKKILERLSNSGDDKSMVNLSGYYSEDNKNVKILNLKAGAKFNTTAFYNLGIYYYYKKDNNKSKFYLKKAKEMGYELPIEMENFINKK